MATMTDVARRAGVAVSTVSYVLSGGRPVTDETRERVEQAMRDLDFTPNELARGLKSRRSRILALVFPQRGRGMDLTSLEYILAASDRAQKAGYHLLLWTAERGELPELARFAAKGLVDGVVLMEVGLRDERVDLLRRASIPFVLVGRTQDSAALDYVDSDFDATVDTAIRYLVALGHHALAIVNQAPAVLDASYGPAVRVEEAARRVADDLGVEVVTLACESTAAAGALLFERLRSERRDVTAAVVLNEQAAPGILTGIHNAGLSVPRDFSVVALAMSSATAELTTPPLTTVSAPGAAIGRVAVDALMARLDDAESPPLQRLFAPMLVVRSTSGPAA